MKRVTLLSILVSTLVGCGAAAPSPGATNDRQHVCGPVTDVQVMTLGRPPSAKPALDIDEGTATGRIVVGGGEYGPYQFIVKPLSAADWEALQAAACNELSPYPAGTVTYIRDSGPGFEVGGQIDVDVRQSGVGTGLSFDSGKASADPLVTDLRSLATKYFTAATF